MIPKQTLKKKKETTKQLGEDALMGLRRIPKPAPLNFNVSCHHTLS